MSSSAEPQESLVFLGFKEAPTTSSSNRRIEFYPKPAVSLIQKIVSNPAKSSLVVCRNKKLLNAFHSAVLKSSLPASHLSASTNLICLTPPSQSDAQFFHSTLKRVLGLFQLRWLPHRELIAALSSESPAELFIGGYSDTRSKTMTLFRGDLSAVTVPFSHFDNRTSQLSPDFKELAFIDYGRTVALGDFEVSSDALLYEFDSVYRRKLKKHRKQTEQSLGASIRRLRLQRNLRQADFGDIDARTIGRIERGEGSKPRLNTLQEIAHILQVPTSQLIEF